MFLTFFPPAIFLTSWKFSRVQHYSMSTLYILYYVERYTKFVVINELSLLSCNFSHVGRTWKMFLSYWEILRTLRNYNCANYNLRLRRITDVLFFIGVYRLEYYRLKNRSTHDVKIYTWYVQKVPLIFFTEIQYDLNPSQWPRIVLFYNVHYYIYIYKYIFIFMWYNYTIYSHNIIYRLT